MAASTPSENKDYEVYFTMKTRVNKVRSRHDAIQEGLKELPLPWGYDFTQIRVEEVK